MIESCKFQVIIDRNVYLEGWSTCVIKILNYFFFFKPKGKDNEFFNGFLGFT